MREHIHNVIVAIGAVVKFDAKRILPFLGLEQMVSKGRVKNKALEIQFADSAQFRSRLEIYVKVVTDAVCQLNKTNLGVEVGSNFPTLRQNFQPVGLIVKARADVGLPRRKARRSSLGSISVQHQVLEENQARIRAFGLIETVEWIPGTLVNPQYADVRTAPQ